jgi:hypothetical protein
MTTRDKVREHQYKTWLASPAAAKEDLGWETTVPLVVGPQRQIADWEAKRRRDRAMPSLPRSDRAVITYTLALLVGILLESLALFGRLYEFSPPWLIFVVIGGLMGAVSFFTVSWPGWAQFVAGAAVGVGAELLNVWVPHAWTFNPRSFGAIPNELVRAIVLGLPAGLMPLGVNAIVRGLYRRRLRLG